MLSKEDMDVILDRANDSNHYLCGIMVHPADVIWLIDRVRESAEYVRNYGAGE